MTYNKFLTFTLLTGVAMLYSGSALADCPNGITPDVTTGACIQTGGCTQCSIYWVSNEEGSYDVIVRPNKDAEGDVTLGGWNNYGFRPYRNLTLEEGITSIGQYDVMGGSGTLKLPSTLTSMSSGAIYSVGFTTIDVSDVKNFQSGGGGYGALQNTIAINGAYNLQNLIVSEDTSPISFGYSYDYQYPSGTVMIQCKGKPDICQNKVSTANASWVPEDFGLESQTYVKTDANDNIIEKWNGNGVVKFSYDGGGNMVRQTDEHGNVLWARRIYTLKEAEAATGPVNRVSIKYR